MRNDVLIGFFQIVGVLAPPRLDASSECQVTIQGQVPNDGLTHRYFQTAGRMRYDILEGTRLIRTYLAQYDKRKMWTLYPRQQQFEEMSFWPSPPKLEGVTQVKETLKTGPATHFRGVLKNVPPLELDLDWWLAADGFILKTVVHVRKRCDSLAGEFRKSWEFVKIERKPQAKLLFEVTSEYQPRSLGDKPKYNVGEMMKNTQIQSGKLSG